MIGETVYLVSSHQFHLPPPEILPGPPAPDKPDPGEALRLAADPNVSSMLWPGPNPGGSDGVYETRAQYWARIGDGVLDLALSNYTLRDAAGNSIAAGLLSSAEATYRPLGGQDDQLVSITAFDVGGAQPAIAASSSAPLGWAGTVYVSPQNLYLVRANWAEAGESSELFKFALRPEQGQIPLVATGQVPGRVLNAFSLDEQGSYLRIVTHSGWRASAESALYVLEPRGEKLATVGKIEDLAPAEELYSVRFLGDRAFVVTFGPDDFTWIDPLFTIDLSVPAAPQVEGQLEIPGFSNYLQLIDGGIDGEFLIGLGRNADETSGRQLGPQVSLFDVSRFEKPLLADRVSFGDVSSWSDAFFNHHAISYFPDQQILAVPLDTWTPAAVVVDVAGDPVLSSTWDGEASPPPRWQSQLWVFRVDTAGDRLHVLGTIEHDSSILRSLRIGKQLFSVSGDTIQAHDIFDPGKKLGELDFGPRAQDDWFPVDRDSQGNVLDVLANDRIGANAGGVWTISSVVPPEGGGVVLISDDGLTLLYTPAPDFVGQESFAYTITSPDGATDEAHVTVDVNTRAEQQRMTKLAQLDLADRLSVPVDEIGVLSVEDVQWSDSCLGVPVPGQACLTVITPGFRISLQHGTATYVYHTDTRDTVILARSADANPDPWSAGASDPVVRVRLEATDADGQVVTTIQAGQTLTLNLYVDDLRDSGAGVFATYADILYPARLVSLDEGEPVFDEAYVNGKSGDVERTGLLNELGAFGGQQELGQGERRLASISFVARRAGTAAFVLTPADAIGHDVLIYGSDVAVPARLVEWQGVEVQVVGGWRNSETPTDVNDDGRTTPQDALHCINAINAHGKQQLERAELRAAAGVAAAADQFFFDVDGDDTLTPTDVVLIVNQLNAGGETPGIGSSDAGLPARPLASWVDWKSLQDLLHEDRWQRPLEALHLSAEPTLDLVHELLVSVDADRLNDLLQNPVSIDPAQWKDAIGPVLDAIQEHVSVDQLLDLADQLDANFQELDLRAILPGLAPQIDLTAAGEVFHDAFFTKLSDPLFLLDLLDS
jgi:hypothetical protein